MNKLLIPSLLLSFSAFADLSYEEIKWAPTNLRPLFLDNTITVEFCGREAIRYKGCVAAVELFARVSDQKKELVTENGSLVFKESDQFALKEKNFREYQRTQRLKLNKIEAEFSPKQVQSLVSLYKKLRKENPNPKPYQIALPLNESLAVTYDPHKQYIPIFRYNGQNLITLKPSMNATVENINGEIVVSSVAINGGAEKAGIKVDDVLLEIDGEPAKESGYDFANEQMVPVKVKRQGRTFEVPVKFTWKRPHPVTDREISYGGQNYGYLHLAEIPNEFDTSTTCNVFQSFLSKFEQKFDGLILDLRDNLGGEGDTAACIATLFLGKQKRIFVEADFMDMYVEDVLADFPLIFKKKMVVLVNARTASSGEIMASAIQFHGRAPLIGDRTFGKAIGQQKEDFLPDRIAMLFTSLKSLRPDGTNYHGKGLIPDVYVYRHGMTKSAREREVLREEDLALFPLKIEDGKFYEAQAPRFQVPTECISEDAVAKNVIDLDDSDWKKDFQLQYALETLRCIK